MAAFPWLDRLGLGWEDEDVADVRELMRRADLFVSVILAPPESVLYRLLSSTLDLINHKNRGVLDRVKVVGYTENNEDIQIVSELMDDIRDAVVDYQVSGDLDPFLQAPSFSRLVLGVAPTVHI